MARPSTASLSLVPPQALARLPIPEGLNEAESALCLAVINSKPADWFQADSAPVLKEYVRAVAMCDYLSIQIEMTLAGDDDVEEPGLKGLGLKGYLDMRDKESKRVLSLATKLRLTQQSRYTPQAAATANRKAGNSQGDNRPWQTAAS